jgi:hypothetical protein
MDLDYLILGDIGKGNSFSRPRFVQKLKVKKKEKHWIHEKLGMEKR